MSLWSEYDYVTTSPTGRIWVSKSSFQSEQRVAIVGEYPHDQTEIACRKLIEANNTILRYIERRKKEELDRYQNMQNELALLVPKKGKTEAENMRIYEITHSALQIQMGLPTNHIAKLNETVIALTKIIN